MSGKYITRTVQINKKHLALQCAAAGILLWMVFPRADSVFDMKVFFGIPRVWLMLSSCLGAGCALALPVIVFLEYREQQRKLAAGESLDIRSDTPTHSISDMGIYRRLRIGLPVILLGSLLFSYITFERNTTFRIAYYQTRLDLAWSDESRYYFQKKWDTSAEDRLAFLKSKANENVFYTEYYVAAMLEYTDQLLKNIGAAHPEVEKIIQQIEAEKAKQENNSQTVK